VPVAEQVLQFYAASSDDASGKNWIRDYPVASVLRYMDEMTNFCKAEHASLLELVNEKQELTDEVQTQADAMLEAFRKIFVVADEEK